MKITFSVYNYIYILFWNSLWTIAPVVGIGIFDRFLGEYKIMLALIYTIFMFYFIDAHVLMQVPELYRYGREGTWFSLRSFLIYIFDGIVQVSYGWT